MYKLFLLLFCALTANILSAQDTLTNKYISSDVVPLTGKQGISWQTRNGDFLFKPYVLVQTLARMNYYDDEGLDLSEQDHVLNSGFGMPYALLGFSGKAFNKVTFNMAINATGNGAALLNQAWFDINTSDALRFRVGKFKTPFNQAYLVQVGETMFPTLPSSLSTPVNLPFDINSVNPNLSTGFDIGVQMHGLLRKQWEYRLGIFNGTGISVNEPQRTTSDDLGIPALLYAGRLAWTPFGAMPVNQGNPDDLSNHKLMVAASASYNVEANYESSNDCRAGLEVSYLHHRLFLSGEAYLMNTKFVERQKTSPSYTFAGAYLQAGYFVTNKLQPVCRIDAFDRNGLSEKGFLLLPAGGFNYFFSGYNLKLQAMYQYMAKLGHATTYDADDDDNGLAEHQVNLMLQFSF